MNKKELNFILKQGEGQFIEFKEGFDKYIAKEMVAFANVQGGKIFLGITDQKEARGINITNSLKSQIQDVARNCDPSIKIKMEEFDNILIIEVEEGTNKPYTCSNGFYLRNGPNSQKLTRDEILDFSIEEGRISFDEQICNKFDYPTDFDLLKLKEYLQLTKLINNLSTENLLINLKVAKKIKDEIKFNNAGVLFFAKEPEKFFMTSKVVCVDYQTNEKVNILDKKIFDEGIIRNIQNSINYVNKHIDVLFEIKAARRREIPQYPLEAYREAIVNAVMHRDYFQKSGEVTIEVFRNKITISNPGGLVKWLKPEDFGKISSPRNQLIAELLSKTELVEKLGTGINRMKKAMANAGLPELLFSFNSFFSITLLDVTKGQGRDVPENVPENVPEDRKSLIITEIKNNSKITIPELALILKVNEKTIKRDIEKLKFKGIIKRVGPDKGGHWEMVKHK
ncbi:putative DNA binding domain-containing protein [Candidatus Woesearchaeota archaeon]|nr:putative DNA binding domain-containing protein [Candidatus Woesearchaeota archaeon]